MHMWRKMMSVLKGKWKQIISDFYTEFKWFFLWHDMYKAAQSCVCVDGTSLLWMWLQTVLALVVVVDVVADSPCTRHIMDSCLRAGDHLSVDTTQHTRRSWSRMTWQCSRTMNWYHNYKWQDTRRLWLLIADATAELPSYWRLFHTRHR